ncbi:hypothetical protein DJ480_00325 [Pseudomonas sp. Leaf98]|nr:hypothetical protein DJ480_00325 [Pseudomonas sp. Leaf98]
MLISLLSNGQPQTPDRLELIAPWWSFTKTVLAATALSLVRDGLIGLDDPIPDHPFTLRQLLRHEAGLADYGELAEYHTAVTNGEPAWTADEMMRRLDGTRLRYTCGTGWRYVSVRQTHLDHTILPRAPQNHAHLQGFSKRLVKSPWFGIRA